MANLASQIIKAFSELKELTISSNLKLPKDRDAEVANLKLAIEEQRRVYDWLSISWSELRNKVTTFLGGGLATLIFVYSDISHIHKGNQLFIPPETYGKIFYYFGLGAILFGIGCLLIALKPAHWEFPTEKERLKRMDFNSHVEYLRYTRDRYVICYSMNLPTYEFKHKLFNTGFYPLVFGAIILVVLKLFA